MNTQIGNGVWESSTSNQLPFKFYRENGPWHCQRTSLLNWGPSLWVWEASMSHFKLPSSWQASLQSIPNRCLPPYLQLQKRTGTHWFTKTDLYNKTVIRGRIHLPVETNVPVPGRQCKTIRQSHWWWVSRHANSCCSAHPSASAWPSSVSNKEKDGPSLTAIHHKLYFPVWVRQGEMMTKASLRYNLSFLCLVLEEDIFHDITFQVQRAT